MSQFDWLFDKIIHPPSNFFVEIDPVSINKRLALPISAKFCCCSIWASVKWHAICNTCYIYIIISITNRVPSDDLYLSSLRYHTITE